MQDECTNTDDLDTSDAVHDAKSTSSENQLLELASTNGNIDYNGVYDESLYKMHRYAYEGDLKSLTHALHSRDKTVDLSRKDKHGESIIFLFSVLIRWFFFSCPTKTWFYV